MKYNTHHHRNFFYMQNSCTNDTPNKVQLCSRGIQGPPQFWPYLPFQHSLSHFTPCSVTIKQARLSSELLAFTSISLRIQVVSCSHYSTWYVTQQGGVRFIPWAHCLSACTLGTTRNVRWVHLTQVTFPSKSQGVFLCNFMKKIINYLKRNHTTWKNHAKSAKQSI